MFEELNYYQILEVTPDASFSRIRQAYRDILSLYENDDVLADAFFTEAEKENIIDTIHQAFSILYDKDKRAAYDRYCFPHKTHPPWGTAHSEGDQDRKNNTGNSPTPLFQNEQPLNQKELMTHIKAMARTSEATAMAESLLAKNAITGSDIQSYRRMLGLTVEKIFELTRIAASTIRQIENDEFEKLPPAIYLKSFLATYAEILHLPPKSLVNGYLANMNPQG